MEHNQVSELGKDSFQNLRQLQQLSLKANKVIFMPIFMILNLIFAELKVSGYFLN
jgi:hypothetical protein